MMANNFSDTRTFVDVRARGGWLSWFVGFIDHVKCDLFLIFNTGGRRAESRGTAVDAALKLQTGEKQAEIIIGAHIYQQT